MPMTEKEREAARIEAQKSLESVSGALGLRTGEGVREGGVSLYDALDKLSPHYKFVDIYDRSHEARKTARDTDVAKYNAQLAASVDQFYAQQDFSTEQFNAKNALVIEQSNVQWRRDITKVNTAAQQQINMLNAQNAFGLNASTQAQLWQEVRDEFDYIWKSSENGANRETNIAVAGMAGEHSALKNGSNMTRLKSLMDLFKHDYYGGGD